MTVDDIQKLCELVKKHNLAQLSVDNVSIVNMPNSYPIFPFNENDKKMTDNTDETDDFVERVLKQ